MITLCFTHTITYPLLYNWRSFPPPLTPAIYTTTVLLLIATELIFSNIQTLRIGASSQLKSPRAEWGVNENWKIPNEGWTVCGCVGRSHHICLFICTNHDVVFRDNLLTENFSHIVLVTITFIPFLFLIGIFIWVTNHRSTTKVFYFFLWKTTMIYLTIHLIGPMDGITFFSTNPPTAFMGIRLPISIHISIQHQTSKLQGNNKIIHKTFQRGYCNSYSITLFKG